MNIQIEQDIHHKGLRRIHKNVQKIYYSAAPLGTVHITLFHKMRHEE